MKMMSGTRLEKPQHPSQDNPAGYITGINVSSLVQLIEREQKTCTLQVLANENEGILYFKEGIVFDAQTDDLRGEEAAIRIFGWEKTQIKLENICTQKKKNIHSSLTRLILDGSKLRDEDRYANSHSDILVRAIHLAEGNHLRKAYELIGTYLKTNPNSSMAWFWYSRCLGRIEAISDALSKCSRLAPDNGQISEEIKKIEQAPLHVKNDALVQRCPFCWSPLNPKAYRCYYCLSTLSIAGALREGTLNQVNIKTLIDAVTRYTDVLARENNIKAAYYLSLANCNLNKAEEALDLLNQAHRKNPDNQFLAKQLNVVVDHVASRLTSYEDVVTQKTNKGEWVKPLVSKKMKKILVVDDSPTTRKVIALTLKQKGYALVEAQNGLEALSMIDEEHPDLILLDIILPKMDGYKILSIIKKTPELKDTPVILLTSKDGLIHKVKGKLAGSAAYLTKPFEPKELIHAVGKHMS